MTPTSILKAAEILGILMGAAAFALVTYWRLREKALAARHGLGDNPERCKDHENRLRDMEKACVGIAKDIENIKDDLNEIKRRLQ
jgi:hypothetical protein